jgi:methylenetetrahydrofolate--tRNA-(uracil-5-)-methyltransferase
MTYPEQRRVFRMIPGLEQAEFVRLGSLHRNTFIDSPRLLLPTLQFRGCHNLFFAGQMIGVEGYLESAAAGLLAGRNAGRLTQGLPLLTAPPTTALGSMIAYISSDERRDFQPMNANYGLFPPLEHRLRGREKKAALAERALRDLADWQTTFEGNPLAIVNLHSTTVNPQ